ncbi:c-type cytochrome [Coraliomargarita parva]|uniref:c-type cytochrome n=1 Tax=Coraliomargarita parva TaxID=3014050 RepID=UPI0022B31685|nr:c-type cytochrome [Coraliomargarita parva]
MLTLLIIGVLLYLGQVLYLLRGNSPRGFVLPDGDIAAGKAAFVELGCVQCHTVRGVTLPETEGIPPENIIALGGKQHIAKTYGQLVTAVMHPSANLYAEEGRYLDTEGRSMMPDYKSKMTVEQLVDIVSFLQEHYDVFVPDYDPQYFYTPYDYGAPSPY